MDFEQMLKQTFSGATIMLGAAFALVSLGLAWLINKIAPVTIQLATIDLRGKIGTGLSTDIVTRILSYVGGNFSIPNLLMVVLAGVVIVLLGRLVYLIYPVGKTTMMKLLYTFVAGSIVSSVILYGMGAFQTDWTFYAVLVGYSALIAFIIGKVYEALDWKLPSM